MRKKSKSITIQFAARVRVTILQNQALVQHLSSSLRIHEGASNRPRQPLATGSDKRRLYSHATYFPSAEIPWN